MCILVCAGLTVCYWVGGAYYYSKRGSRKDSPASNQQPSYLTGRMVDIPDSDRNLLLYKTHLYNVIAGRFDEVAVLVDTASNVVFVDSAYCADQQPCEVVHVDHGAGTTCTTSHSQRGIAVIRGKQNQQNISYKAFPIDMSNKTYKLELSAHAATRLGILKHPAVHRSTPTNKLCELPSDLLDE